MFKNLIFFVISHLEKLGFDIIAYSQDWGQKDYDEHDSYQFLWTYIKYSKIEFATIEKVIWQYTKKTEEGRINKRKKLRCAGHADGAFV